jgi:hypothetical protein
MKSLIFIFIFMFINIFAQAQERYIKHLFGAGIGGTKFQDWKSKRTEDLPINAMQYNYFLHKNIGIGIHFYAISSVITHREAQKYKIWSEEYQNDYFLPHIFFRQHICFDFPISYRLNYKKHSLTVGAGLVHIQEISVDRRDNPMYEGVVVTRRNEAIKNWGYCASLTYQFRVSRNFGLSADVIFRQSKDIPNTLSYGFGLTYSIFNKRKAKE